MDPESDPLGTGYHISQSKIAIGSGGILGKGFLNGTQSHLDYLPEGHTDFVFATMAEEWGLVGGVLLILAFFLVIRWGVNVGLSAQGRFARLAAAGLATTIFFYVAINLMMVMVWWSGPGRRHPTSPRQLRRLRANDGADLRRYHDVDRPRKPQDGALVEFSNEEVFAIRQSGCYPPPSDGDGAPRRAIFCRYGRIAQLVEQLTLNQRVLGSSPSASTKLHRKINNLDHLNAAAAVGHFGLGYILGYSANVRLFCARGAQAVPSCPSTGADSLREQIANIGLAYAA